MTIITIICILIIGIIVAPEVVLSVFGAAIALPLSAYILYLIAKLIKFCGCSYIEKHYKIIEIGGKEYTMYEILKKGYDCVYESEKWGENTKYKLCMKPDLPFDRNKPIIYRRNIDIPSLKRIVYFFRLKDGQYGLYKYKAEEPSYIYDEEGNVHKV